MLISLLSVVMLFLSDERYFNQVNVKFSYVKTTSVTAGNALLCSWCAEVSRSMHHQIRSAHMSSSDMLRCDKLWYFSRTSTPRPTWWHSSRSRCSLYSFPAERFITPESRLNTCTTRSSYSAPQPRMQDWLSTASVLASFSESSRIISSNFSNIRIPYPNDNAVNYISIIS